MPGDTDKEVPDTFNDIIVSCKIKYTLIGIILLITFNYLTTSSTDSDTAFSP